MKRITAVFAALLMLTAFAACGQQKNETKNQNPNPTPTTKTETLTPQADWKKASPVYAAFLAQFDGFESACAADLNGDGYPEVIATTNDYLLFALTYTEKGGLSVLYPKYISPVGIHLFVSEDNGFYYRVDGHTTGTAHEHAAYLYSVDETGFVLENHFFGDNWPDGVDYSSNDAIEEMDEKYDRLFDEKLQKALGDKTYQALSERTQSEDIDAYLNEALHIDLAAARTEYASAKQSLSQAVTDAAGKKPNNVFVSDYDRSGTYEAFAFVKDDKQEFDGFVTGSLWFVNAQGKADRVMENADGERDAQILSCTYHDYYQMPLFAGSSAPAAVWEVKGDECRQLDLFDIGETDLEVVEPVGDIWLLPDTLISTQSVFDMEVSAEETDEMMGTGHTHKPYFFRDTPEGVKEYGGIEVKETDLEAFSGGKELLDWIRKDGKTIRSIFYRENGVVSISFYEQADGVIHNSFLNVVLTENRLEWLSTGLFHSFYYDEECCGEGTYSAAAAPDFATYPKSMK